MGSYLFGGDGDRIDYQANLAALSLSNYIILIWVRRASTSHANGRICQRGAANSTATDHMQLIAGDASAGAHNESFSLRQDTGTTDGRRVATINNDVLLNDTWTCIGAHYVAGTSITLYTNGAEQTIDAGSAAGPTGTTTTKETDKFTLGSNDGNQRPFGGHLAALGIWDGSALVGTVADLVSDFYNAGTGTADVPEQDALVDFVHLNANGAIDGDLGVLDGTANGASYDSGQSAPVTYNAIGGGGNGDVTAVPADSTGDVPAPTVSGNGNATVTAVPADAAGDVPAPGVSGNGNATVAAVPAESAGSVPAASMPISVEVVPPPADALGDAPAPAVSGNGNATVTPPAADSLGDVPVPGVSGDSPSESTAGRLMMMGIG
jgi:hypothetical protein